MENDFTGLEKRTMAGFLSMSEEALSQCEKKSRAMSSLIGWDLAQP